MQYIWKNGAFEEYEQSKTHTLSHALHYGSGVFEGIRCYKTDKGTAIFRLKEHVERLFYSAQVLRIKVPYTKEEVTQAIIDTVNKNKLESGYIRPLINYGHGKMGLIPYGADIDVTIAAWPWGKYLGEHNAKVQISEMIRPHPRSSDMKAKISGMYHNSILAGIKAKENGFDEALLLDYQGNIAEGPGENIFFIKGDTLMTPKAGCILPGITRDTIIQLAKQQKLTVKQEEIKPEQIADYDAAFFCGTAAEVTIIASINDHEFTTLTHATMLKQLYDDTVKGKKTSEWLTFCTPQ